MYAWVRGEFTKSASAKFPATFFSVSCELVNSKQQQQQHYLREENRLALSIARSKSVRTLWKIKFKFKLSINETLKRSWWGWTGNIQMSSEQSLFLPTETTTPNNIYAMSAWTEKSGERQTKNRNPIRLKLLEVNVFIRWYFPSSHSAARQRRCEREEQKKTTKK